MPDLVCELCPEETVSKRRARTHQWSPKTEEREAPVETTRATPPAGYPPIRLTYVDIGGKRPWTREAIYGDGGR